MPSKQGPRLYWRLSNLEHPNADLEKTVKDHLLNHAIQVLLPYDTVDKELQEELDVQLVTMLPPDEGYQVIRASLADILAQVLNTGVILQEDTTLQALSLADRLESNHAVAITPDGMLHLATSGEVHARLGLTGVHSPSNPDRYNISLDLRSKSLQPGQDRYAQVLSKVRTVFPAQAFILRLEVKGELQEIGLPPEALTPSYGTEAWLPLESTARTQPGLMLPPLSRDTFEQLGREGDWQLRRAITGLHTWLGALACGQGHTLCNDLLPDEVMPLQLVDEPLPSREEQDRRLLGTMVSRMWKGMISQKQVLDVMKATSAMVVAKQVPWAAVHVWGFADTPVAWRGLEHGTAWGGAGESNYTVVFLGSGDYCIYKALGPEDMNFSS
ncbi:hypothetical protein VOLCADRAFT_118706 [Volvox carteri f. nagariensis]|uniref:Uncharacterized protein mot31 n=1 Tax=Volvox carteri f. nagariensis TaxID=3068 RepID=D8U6T3_VOLCA|nr:uncharacterized protein VOLCADRAFT_118706 [Volvox carteri f. nagariensis]EFJ44567.1 hypothetical protein VOLCADRAFT_118706 [Volvox carteri f. nagariensis]|eukprot:XP_002954417.1 hypothetical protein VOLCADRAFT_118706 [Volvox carteri f. nagariensis]